MNEIEADLAEAMPLDVVEEESGEQGSQISSFLRACVF